ncbi:hypothetical protein [Novipirellula rosea]|uniref:hypothetical protein n=1 Tax=Novipirellula rosea TaxID=1031540 RepID=UPI0031F06055
MLFSAAGELRRFVSVTASGNSIRRKFGSGKYLNFAKETTVSLGSLLFSECRNPVRALLTLLGSGGSIAALVGF